MASMISLVRRGGWLAGVAVFVVWVGVWAEKVDTPSPLPPTRPEVLYEPSMPPAQPGDYIITKGLDGKRYYVSRRGEWVNEMRYVTIDSALTAIRKSMAGKAVTIRFDTTGGVVNGAVNILQKKDVTPRWGNVTVTGSIKSLYLSSDSGMFNVTLAGKISAIGIIPTDAVNVGENVTLRMDSCVVTTEKGYGVYSVDTNVKMEINGCNFITPKKSAVYNQNGNIKIIGGEFEAGGTYAIYTKRDLDMVGVRVVSTGSGGGVYSEGKANIVGGEIESGSGFALRINGGGEIKGGTYKATKGYALHIVNSIKITGGVFESKESDAIYARQDLDMVDVRARSIGTGRGVYSIGKVKIVGGEFEAGSGSALSLFGVGESVVSGDAKFINRSGTNATIDLIRGSIRLAGVDIMNNNMDGQAIRIANASCRLVLGGPASPRVRGGIAPSFAGTISVDADFRPAKNKYVLELLCGAGVAGAVAVVGGGEYVGAFDYSNKYHRLDAEKGNIVVVLKDKIVPPSYVVDGDTINGFVARIKTVDSDKVIGKNSTVWSVLDSIRGDADGRPCQIQFGNGDSVLNIGRRANHGIRIISETNGVGWGRVTLVGKVSHIRSGGRGKSYALYVGNGMSVESSLDIPVATGHSGGVYVGVGSNFTHDGGVLCDRIHNNGGIVKIKEGNVPYIDNTAGGSLEIVDGVVGSDTLHRYAIKNDQSCEIIISGKSKIVSADTSKAGGVIISSGALEIYDSEVLNTNASKGGISIAFNVGSTDSTKADSDNGDDAVCSFVMGGTPTINGAISLSGTNNIPIILLAADKDYKFDPQGKSYSIAGSVKDGRVVLKNGARFIRNFVLDATGNAGLKLAVNGDDVVTAKSTVTVSFDLNGSKSADTPSAIVVMTGGTVGESVKPSIENYAKIDTVGNVIYMVHNDGVWHLHNGDGINGIVVGEEFDFGVGDDGTTVNSKKTLTLKWKKEGEPIGTISVQESTRDLPSARTAESAAVSPIAAVSGGLTVGPSPVSGAVGAVNFFRSGATLKGGKLFIYDASGNAVTRLIISDLSGSIGKRSVASWNLRDAKSRQAAEGTYVAKGVIFTKAGKTERVSLLINVR